VEYKEKGREVTVENQLNKMENTKDWMIYTQNQAISVTQ
jgi:hypothetical protein